MGGEVVAIGKGAKDVSAEAGLVNPENFVGPREAVHQGDEGHEEARDGHGTGNGDHMTPMPAGVDEDQQDADIGYQEPDAAPGGAGRE